MGESPAKGYPLLNLTRILPLLIVAVLITTTGCSRIYYDMRESLGTHKRDILKSRVLDARDEQEEAKEEFRDALAEFRSVVSVDGGELEANYDRLNAAFERSNAQAEQVRKRINSVEDVAEALFDEWERELGQYSSDRLRRNSEAQLRDTRRRYDDLIGAMRRAEERMDPVLDAFRDQVLYLKHNLNAAAIAALQGEVIELEEEIDRLIREMEQSINEANDFIHHMEGTPQGGELIGG